MKTICLRAVLLAAALAFFTSCGGASPNPSETPAPEPAELPAAVEEASAQLIAVPEAFRGRWINMGDPKEIVEFAPEGFFTVNGEEIPITSAAARRVGFDWAYREGTCEMEYGCMHIRQLSALSSRSREGWFYREGEVNPIGQYIGRWNLADGEGQIWRNAVVETYTVTDELRLLINGDSIPLECRPGRPASCRPRRRGMEALVGKRAA